MLVRDVIRDKRAASGQNPRAATAARKSDTMAKLPITFACGLYDRMLPLYTKEVEAEGIDLNFLAIDSPREIFDRMSGALEFDVSEMSSSEYVAR